MPFTIGWIGLGKMGAPMARNIAAAGYRVQAFNRSPRESDIGACTRVSSPAQAAAGADILILMVSDESAVRNSLFGQDGAASELTPGTLVVNMSTIGVSETKQLALELANRGVEWMDAPVSGTVKPAEDGTLVVMAGGSEAAFNKMQPVFACVSRRALHIGEVGAGSAMKLCINAFLGMMMAAAGECMITAEKIGLGRDTFLEVLEDTTMWSPTLAAKRPQWLNDEYPAAFSLKHMVKDLGLMLQQVAMVSAPAPALFATYASYLTAQAAGFAEDDMAAITAYLNRVGGNA